MSDQSTAPRRRARATSDRPERGNVVSRLFGAIGLYFAQVLDQMRKVVPPTRQELTRYTLVVIAFVTVIMLFVFGLDTVFTRLVFWVFAGSS